MYTACLRFGLDIMQGLDTQEQSLHHNINISLLTQNVEKGAKKKYLKSKFKDTQRYSMNCVKTRRHVQLIISSQYCSLSKEWDMFHCTL